MTKPFGKAIEAEANRRHEQGETLRELAASYGLTHHQMDKLLQRYRTKLRRKAEGQPPKPIGRPRKDGYLGEPEIDRLKRENELLRRENAMIRDFLQDIGRK